MLIRRKDEPTFTPITITLENETDLEELVCLLNMTKCRTDSSNNLGVVARTMIQRLFTQYKNLGFWRRFGYWRRLVNGGSL